MCAMLGIWEDMPSTTYRYDPTLSKSSNVHEATHFINATLIKGRTYGIWCTSQTFVLESPMFKKTELIPYVPIELRFDRFDNYFENNHYNDYPFYLLDELSAYVNGTSCALENPKNTDSIDHLASIVEMEIYAVCLLNALKDKSPQLYQANRDQIVQIMKLGYNTYVHGYDHLNHAKLEPIISVLTMHPLYATMEEILGENCFAENKNEK